MDYSFFPSDYLCVWNMLICFLFHVFFFLNLYCFAYTAVNFLFKFMLICGKFFFGKNKNSLCLPYENLFFIVQKFAEVLISPLYDKQAWKFWHFRATSLLLKNQEVINKLKSLSALVLNQDSKFLTRYYIMLYLPSNSSYL